MHTGTGDPWIAIEYDGSAHKSGRLKRIKDISTENMNQHIIITAARPAKDVLFHCMCCVGSVLVR